MLARLASLMTRPTGASALAAPVRRSMSTVSKSYSERMNATGRPISPHLYGAPEGAGDFIGGIYAMPTVAWTSILVRITGVCLTIGTTGVGFMTLAGGSEAPGNFASSLASSSAAPVAKFAVGFSVVYHYLGACRHTFWDKTIKGFSNKQMLQSSYALVGASVLISLGLASYSLPPKKKKD